MSLLCFHKIKNITTSTFFRFFHSGIIWYFDLVFWEQPASINLQLGDRTKAVLGCDWIPLGDLSETVRALGNTNYTNFIWKLTIQPFTMNISVQKIVIVDNKIHSLQFLHFVFVALQNFNRKKFIYVKKSAPWAIFVFG